LNERGPYISKFLRNAETFVDLIEVLWILRGLWLVAAIPCFGISLLGIAFGGNIVLGSSIFANGWLGGFACFLIGAAGIAGILGAAIRLSNSAEALAEQTLRRITAKVCLSVGLVASIFLLAPMVDSLTGIYSLLFPFPFLFGMVLFAATIGIKPLAESSAETEHKTTTPV